MERIYPTEVQKLQSLGCSIGTERSEKTSQIPQNSTNLTKTKEFYRQNKVSIVICSFKPVSETTVQIHCSV